MIDLRKELKGREGFCTAVMAMIDGLEKQDKRKDFMINMGTYGNTGIENNKIVCIGCAATCAIQQYFGINFNSEYIRHTRQRSLYLNVNTDVLNHFEQAIDHLRFNNPEELSKFCYLTDEDASFIYTEFMPLPKMWNDTWKVDIRQYKEAVEQIMTHWDLEFKLEDVA